MPEPKTSYPADLTRNTLGVLAIGVLAGTCFWIARPFLVPATWATMIVVATWPMSMRLQAVLWGRRQLATIVMTLALLLVFIIPATVAVGTIVVSADQIVAWARDMAARGLPPAPAWLAELPVVGPKIREAWDQLASAGPAGLAAQLEPYFGKLTLWFVARAGGAGRLAFEFLLTVIMAAILYSAGDQAANGVLLFVRRLAGPRGERAVVLAARSVRGVALGVVVTAIVQSILAGIGLAICGVPAAGILTAVTFIFCIAQIGPGIILFSATGWLYWSGNSVWATILLVWSLVVVTIDNILRPVLIKMGADLPLLLIFAGVLGGMVAFGIVGIFIGPAVLAVVHTLLSDWIAHGDGDVAEKAA